MIEFVKVQAPIDEDIFLSEKVDKIWAPYAKIHVYAGSYPEDVATLDDAQDWEFGLLPEGQNIQSDESGDDGSESEEDEWVRKRPNGREDDDAHGAVEALIRKSEAENNDVDDDYVHTSVAPPFPSKTEKKAAKKAEKQRKKEEKKKMKRLSKKLVSGYTSSGSIFSFGGSGGSDSETAD